MIENTWKTQDTLVDGSPFKNRLIWAHGDTTGFGFHADFTNGKQGPISTIEYRADHPIVVFRLEHRDFDKGSQRSPMPAEQVNVSVHLQEAVSGDKIFDLFAPPHQCRRILPLPWYQLG
jgi:hypothetical protein